MLSSDRPLLAEIKRREAADLALFAFARRLAATREEERRGGANATDNRTTEHGAIWADEFSARVLRLQSVAPPQRATPLVFTHIPKCAGSSFRNQLLLEYTRLHRASSKFACVLYKDVHFREKHAGVNSTLTIHGPDCLDPETGYMRDSVLVVTGHIAFHPTVLSRLKPPSFAAVVFLREPLARLVSLYNMYPDGTFGAPPANATPAERFAHVYRRRFVGRNALTCFTSGLTLCDSVGALSKTAVGALGLRRARYNLLHRYDVFGLTERSEQSMALIAWAFGWLPALQRRGARGGGGRGGENSSDVNASSSSSSASSFFSSMRRVTPGGEHRRLELGDLCALPELLELMRREEAADLVLYRFAVSVYEQRLRSVPNEVLGLVPQLSATGAPKLPCGDMAPLLDESVIEREGGRLAGVSKDDLITQP